MPIPILTEYQEQCLLVQYLELKGFLFSKLAQETYTKSWGVKMKNKMSGVRPGVPDMLIILPTKKLLFIEMKRSVGGRTSPEQIKWIKELNDCTGVIAVEAHGFEEAKKFVDRLCIE
jgi:hypothetical protein